MLHLIGIVIAIGIADSLNPSTVAPALYIATAPDARRALAKFSAGVFAMYFLGGTLIALGPGQLVLSLVPRPSPTTRQVLEVLAGVALLAIAALLWVHRHRLRTKRLPQIGSLSRASWLLGATIMAVELPTAFPYFTALAVIEGSGVDLERKIFLIALFNVCFVIPLLAIQLVLWVAGERADEKLRRVSAFLQRHWPLLLAALAVIGGGITIALGATGTFRVARRLIHHTLKTIKTVIKKIK